MDDAWRVRASSPGVWGDDLDIALQATHRAQTTGRLTAGLLEYAEVVSVTGFARATHVRITQDSGATTFHVVSAVDAECKRLYFVSPKPELSLPYDAALTGLDPNQPLLIESIEYTLLVRQHGRLLAVYEGLTRVPEHARYAPDVLADPWIDPRAKQKQFQSGGLKGLVFTADEAPNPIVVEPMGDPPLVALLQPLIALDAFTPLTGGADGLAALSIGDFIGDPDDPLASYEDRMRACRGLGALERVPEVAIVAVPDINIQPLAPPRYAPLPPCVPDPCLPPPPPAPATPLPSSVGDLPPVFTEQQIFAVQAAMIEHCERRRDRIALLDPPYAIASDDRLGIGAVRAWRQRFESKYAAFYFPWLKVEDPLRIVGSLTRDIPPSGHVAGFYARTDSEIGCHKAPANGALAWVQDVTVAVDDDRPWRAQRREYQCDPGVPRTRAAHLRRAHRIERLRLALCQCPPPVDDDREGHRSVVPMGRVRAQQRFHPIEAASRPDELPAGAVAARRADGRLGARGLLRTLQRGQQSTRRPRQRPTARRDRRRAVEAVRIHRVARRPHRQ